MNIITGTDEREAAIEFAKAAAIRPGIVASTQRISLKPEPASVMFEILEAQEIIAGDARITLLPNRPAGLGDSLAALSVKEPTPGR